MKTQVARTVNPANMRRTDTFKLQAFHVSISGYMGQLHAWKMMCVTNRIIKLLVCVNHLNDKVRLCRRPGGAYTRWSGSDSCWKSSPVRPPLGQSLTEPSPELQIVTGLRNWTESKIAGNNIISYTWNYTRCIDISTLFTDCQSLYNVSLFTESGFGLGLASRRGKEETVQRRAAALWLREAVRPSLKPSWIYQVAENSLDTRCLDNRNSLYTIISSLWEGMRKGSGKIYIVRQLRKEKL